MVKTQPILAPLDQTVDALIALATMAGVEELDDNALRRRVNAIVDLYLVGFGVHTASERSKLARAFQEMLVSPTRAGDRILAMVHR